MFDYAKKEVQKLSDEFKKKYVISIKGKEAILADGLKVLAHEKGIKQLHTDIIQFPSKDNEFTCIVKAVLIGYDYNPITEKVEEVSYSAIADANKNNCSSMVAAAFIRMAETRALSRVLKNYTNTGMVAVEELDEVMDAADDKKNKSNNRNNERRGITAEQTAEITHVMKENNISRDRAKELCAKTVGHAVIASLTYTEASKLIEVFRKEKTA